MPIPAFQICRSARFRGFARRIALLIGFAMVASAPLTAQETRAIELSVPQVRNLAIHKLEGGEPDLAIDLAKSVLKVDPNDALAYYIIARGYARLNDPKLARRAAGYAYRNADPGPGRFEAAQLAAHMSMAGKNYTLAQLWLRRTAIHAPTQEDELLVAQDYKLLRRINPWSLRLQADARPSDNVNNGSDTSRNIIDGVPDDGTIPPAGQALSGLIGSLDIAPSYRLHADGGGMTTLGARLYIERVSLTGNAKQKVPDLTGSDYGATYAELSLTHAFAVGRAGLAEVALAFGDSWYGGERNYRFARLGAEHSWKPLADTRVTLRAEAERRYGAKYLTNDARVLRFGADYGKALGNGDVLNLSVALQDADAKRINGTYSTVSMRASYTLADALGPARLSMGLVMGYTQYDAFLFSLNGAVPRTDRSLYGDLTLIFDRYDYAGFVPTLRLRTGRKTSNFSRYSSREVSVSLGIRSKF